MGNLSQNFSRWEFECKDKCGFNTVDVELLSLLEEARLFFNKPIIITSGCRCKNYNHSVGGSPKSKHKEGCAVDIVVQGIDSEIVQRYFLGKYSSRYGVGSYDGWTHIDVRSLKARW